MQITTTAQTLPLTGMREGNRYFIVVTGVTSTLYLEFQHVTGGAWFSYTYPDATTFNAAAADVVVADIICPVPRMRLRLGEAQESAWTATWVKQTYEKF